MFHIAPLNRQLLELVTRFGLAVPVPRRTDEYLVPSLLRDGITAAPSGWPAPLVSDPRLRLHFYLHDKKDNDKRGDADPRVRTRSGGPSQQSQRPSGWPAGR